MSNVGNSFWEGFSRGLGAFLAGGTSARESASPAGTVRVEPGAAHSKPDVGLSGKAASSLVVGTLAALTLPLIRRSASRRKSATTRSLARGVVAGAGAAGALLILRLLTARSTERPSPEGAEPGTLEGLGTEGDPGELFDELLAGAGRGLIYAALLDPYLPGPPPLRGALVGTADFLAAPLGGLFVRMQESSPIRRVPVISALLDVGSVRDGPFPYFLLEGILLGLIYGHGSD